MERRSDQQQPNQQEEVTIGNEGVPQPSALGKYAQTSFFLRTTLMSLLTYS